MRVFCYVVRGPSVTLRSPSRPSARGWLLLSSHFDPRSNHVANAPTSRSHRTVLDWVRYADAMQHGAWDPAPGSRKLRVRKDADIAHGADAAAGRLPSLPSFETRGPE